MSTGTAVFLDTTIQIGQFVRSSAFKRRLRQRIAAYNVSKTGLVVRQEFRRRLLKEASYLLSQLYMRKSFAAVHRHIIDELPPAWNRKRNICLDVLATIDERDDDIDRTDRMRFFLRDLLIDGLGEFDEIVDAVVSDSGCACAKQAVIEKKKYVKYEFGTDDCKKMGGRCGIVRFLTGHLPNLRRLQEALRLLPPADKTDELMKAEEFINEFLTDSNGTEERNPCLKVGDLLIALESVGIGSFYTMNAKESKQLCPVLGQELVIRPMRADSDDVIYRAVPPQGGIP